ETQLQAATDSLTGLLNRRSLENKVRVLRAAGTPLTIAIADLDHFKQLNDTHGHETGDRALRLFAHVLESSLRSEDVVARYGGEEFVVVLPACSAPRAKVALDDAREAVEAAAAAAGLPAFTASFGIVEAADDDGDLSEVLARADTALFRAKRAGRNRVVIDGVPDDLVAVAPAAGNGTGNGNGAGS
ncbi:MAG: GGDEF domain-containing protein, partial [Myxococcales bacterium]|nr:GGDEF domain-containing protein [Myxococcales bacterium]